MRGSGWIFGIAASVIWTIAIAWPALAAFDAVRAQPTSGIEVRQTTSLMIVSAAWALTAATGALVLGWLPGRVLGQRIVAGRGFVPIATLLLVPICLPAYIVFFAWWQAWPADTWLFRWAIEHGQVRNLRHATLLVGFLCWSWPIVAWCVAGSVAARPAQRDELLALDGAGFARRWLDRLRTDGPGLALGSLIVFFATFANTTSFDLAEVFTFGNELRAIAALGATQRDVLVASIPAMAVIVAGAGAIWVLLALTMRARKQVTRVIPHGLFPGIFSLTLWTVAFALPLALLARNFTTSGRSVGEQIDQFLTFYGRGFLHMLLIACATGIICAVVAAGLFAMWQDRRAWVRAIAHLQAVSWIIAAALPGTLIGAALIAAFNRPWPLIGDALYLSPVIIVIGHTTQFAFIGALLGYWLAVREPVQLRELRALDGAGTLTGLWRTARPRMLAAGAAAFTVALVLSSSEIPITAQVRPPGFDAITTSILNDMHYQRPQTVILAAGAYVLMAAAAAIVVSAVSRIAHGRSGGAG